MRISGCDMQRRWGGRALNQCARPASRVQTDDAYPLLASTRLHRLHNFDELVDGDPRPFRPTGLHVFLEVGFVTMAVMGTSSKTAGRQPGNSMDVQTSRSSGTTSTKQPRFGKSFPSAVAMSMLKMPPGRTSISARDTRPHALGMYHALRCSGWVSASQTSCLGASMNRSRTKSVFGLISKRSLMISIPFA